MEESGIERRGNLASQGRVARRLRLSPQGLGDAGDDPCRSIVSSRGDECLRRGVQTHPILVPAVGDDLLLRSRAQQLDPADEPEEVLLQQTAVPGMAIDVPHDEWVGASPPGLGRVHPEHVGNGVRKARRPPVRPGCPEDIQIGRFHAVIVETRVRGEVGVAHPAKPLVALGTVGRDTVPVAHIAPARVLLDPIE